MRVRSNLDFSYESLHILCIAMENDSGMSELVEIIFDRKSTNQEQIVAHSSIRSNVLTEDFSERLKVVLFIKTLIIRDRYEKFFDSEYRSMLSSHEDYLSSVMSACLNEHEDNSLIFDSFISVCALLIHVNEDIFEKTGLNYRDLNPDIFMVFYQNVLKTAFSKKGFPRFLEYIYNHKYNEWMQNTNGLILIYDPTPSFIIGEYLEEKIKEEIRRYHLFEKVRNNMKSNKDTVRFLAQKVLSTTSVELPALPSESDLITRLVAHRKKKLKEVAEAKRRLAPLTVKSSHGARKGLYLKATTNYFAKQQEEIARHENIIQAVIRHNHSKNSGHENANNQIHEADTILNHLKNTMKSLIEVLDECNKE